MSEMRVVLGGRNGHEQKLAEYENHKNWARSYDYKGDLIDDHALYLPKLKKDT